MSADLAAVFAASTTFLSALSATCVRAEAASFLISSGEMLDGSFNAFAAIFATAVLVVSLFAITASESKQTARHLTSGTNENAKKK
jgi:hypothetical protein